MHTAAKLLHLSLPEKFKEKRYLIILKSMRERERREREREEEEEREGKKEIVREREIEQIYRV